MSLTKRWLDEINEYNARELSPDEEEAMWYADEPREDGFTDVEFAERLEAEVSANEE